MSVDFTNPVPVVPASVLCHTALQRLVIPGCFRAFVVFLLSCDFVRMEKWGNQQGERELVTVKRLLQHVSSISIG